MLGGLRGHVDCGVRSGYAAPSVFSWSVMRLDCHSAAPTPTCPVPSTRQGLETQKEQEKVGHHGTKTPEGTGRRQLWPVGPPGRPWLGKLDEGHVSRADATAEKGQTGAEGT